MINVVKDSTKSAGAKFGPNLDFLGLNYNTRSDMEELHCNASDAKPGVASCQLWELGWTSGTEEDKAV